MPPGALNQDRKAIVQLHTRLDVEAINISKGETDRAAAVPRLAALVPPRRADLVDEVMYRIGRRKADRKTWPPYATVCELAAQVKAVHAGDVKLRGPNGEIVEVVSYIDKMQTRRDVYRLKQHSVFIGDYKSIEDLGRHVDLSTLIEEEPGTPDDPAQLF